MLLNFERLIPFKLDIDPSGYSSDTIVFEREVPSHEGMAAVAMTSFPRDCLIAHFCTKCEHNDYNAVSGDLGAAQGVPISAMMGSPRRSAADEALGTTQGQMLPLWPGEFNDRENLLMRCCEDGVSPDLKKHLALARLLPQTRYPITLWPLQPGKKFTVNMRRTAGSTSMSELVVWCVRLPKIIADVACNKLAFPHWVVKKANYQATGRVEDATTDIRCNPRDGYAFRLRQPFVQGHNAATNAHDESFLQAVSARFKLEDREFYPAIATRRMRLATQSPQFMADFDPARALNLSVGSQLAISAEIEHATTAAAKDIYFSLYGTLERSKDAEFKVKKI